MPAYEVDYSCKEEISGTLPINADDADQAEDFATEEIKDTFPEYVDIVIEAVRKLN